MLDKNYLAEIARTATETAEQVALAGGDERELIQLEVEIEELEEPVEVAGRRGSFIKFGFRYRLWLELVDEPDETIEGELFRRSMRLDLSGKPVALSDRLED